MLWRWYDIFLLIPLWRWLRIIPVTIRLDQAKLIDMSAIQKQARQGFVAEIAGDMTQVVVIQIINELQSSIRQGEIANFLQQREVRPYIDLNETDEVAALTKIMVQMTVNQVLPAIRSDVEDLLKYNVDKILNQSQAYQGLERVPGVESIRNQLTERLVQQITQALYDGLESAIADDPVGDQILQRLIRHLGEAYGSQMQTQKTLDEIQYLLNAFLEEVKVNYVERLSQEDLEDILDQTRAIRQKRQG
jgi:transcriptional regulator NrdR family protein